MAVVASSIVASSLLPLEGCTASSSPSASSSTGSSSSIASILSGPCEAFVGVTACALEVIRAASILAGVFLSSSNFGTGELGAAALVLLVLDITPWWDVRVLWLYAQVGDIIVDFSGV